MIGFVLTERALESGWKTRAEFVQRSDTPVGALWRRGHKPVPTNGRAYICPYSNS